MQIILLLAGLLAAAYLVRKYTTVCPECGAVGKFKDLGRSRGSRDSSYNARRKAKRTGRETIYHTESYECTECGHHFSKRVRTSRRKR